MFPSQWLHGILGFEYLSHEDFATPSAPSIVWGKCKGSNSTQVECGTIQVPLDHNTPNGEQITLGMAKLKATGNRIGSLMYNPGGPGGPASKVVFVQARDAPNASLWSPELTSRYDIIGLDPRGVGLGTPVQCDPGIFNQRVPRFVKTEQEFSKLVQWSKAFSESCKNKTGLLFDHMNTVNVAKDIEIVRQALGEAKLNYLGVSWGSQLGSTYAELYPEYVGRMVLDAVVDHSLSETYSMVEGGKTYEFTLNKFFSWCNTTLDCALHSKDIASIFDKLVEDGDKNPIPAPECKSQGAGACRADVTGEEILDTVAGKLGDPYRWPDLSKDIASAANGNAKNFSRSIATKTTSFDFGYYAVLCQDWVHNSKTFADLKTKQQLLAAFFPHTKGSGTFHDAATVCLGWTAPLSNPPRTFDRAATSRLPPIVLAQAIWDPQTSLAWANSLQSQLPGSVLVVRNGFGHGSHFLQHSQTASALDKFFLTGEVPLHGTTYDS
jgi:pimeloyl-ACP methyl ester carboxylesterase